MEDYKNKKFDKTKKYAWNQIKFGSCIRMGEHPDEKFNKALETFRRPAYQNH